MRPIVIKTLITLLCITTASCASPYQRPDGIAPLQTSGDAERDLLAERGNDRSLALSGGGIRAAYYSIGAMKALYDAGWLQEVDVVSSVSGGGYAAYWLLSSEAAEIEGKPFGYTLLDDVNFVGTLCEVGVRANFVRWWSVAGAFITRRPVTLYHNAIGRSFGLADSSGTLAMADLASITRSEEVPYWIVNTTRYGGSKSRNNIFEITPFHMGTRDAGGRWTDWSITARQATSISGAATDSLRQKITDPLGNGDQELILWDGGRTENLGFYSAALRMPKELIVIDAEHDPGRKVRALITAKTYLDQAGFKTALQAPTLDPAPGSYFEQSFSTGSIAKRGQEIPVRYLKMSLPSSLTPYLTNEDLLAKGKLAQAAVQDRLETTKVGRNWQCSSLGNIDIDTDAWMVWTVGGYAEFMRNGSFTRHYQRLLPTDLKGDFPQYTTVDTSYYNDQARAFVALGYLNGLEMTGRLQKLLE